MRNIHKLNILAASVAMGLSGGVSAGDIGAVNEIFVGGATAPENFFREDLTLRLCDAGNGGPVKVYVDAAPKAFATFDGSGNSTAIMEQGGSHMVVHCTAGASYPAPLGGADIAVYKYNGGSATGVAPVVDPASVADGNKTYLAATTDLAKCVPQTGGIGGGNSWPIGNTGGSYELYVCDTGTQPELLQVQAPDAGISDVEPQLFVGPLALNFGDEPLGVPDKATAPFIDLGNLDVKPGPGLVFGTGVTLPLYNELGADQYEAGMLPECETVLSEVDSPVRATYAGADQSVRDRVECMPSLPSPVIRSVFSGVVNSWADIKPYGLPLDAAAVPEGNNVHICKRTNGSGTHAQFSVNFLGTNCTAANLAMSEINDGLSIAGNRIGVYANEGSSDMGRCMDALGDGEGYNPKFLTLPPNLSSGGDSTVVPGTGLASVTGGTSAVQVRFNGSIVNYPGGKTYDTSTKAFGMGYNSVEKNTQLGENWRFVKVDWAAPTLEDAVAGTYKDVYYLSYQFRKNGSDADLQDGLIRTATTLDNVAVANEYFKIWNATAPQALADVNKGLIVDPDVNGANLVGDEWQTGYVSPVAGAAFEYDGSTPATPWARATLSGAADSCQDFGLVK